MKRTFFLCGLTFLLLFAATSCIFDAPGDKFYRTLWKSDEEGLTLEFLCENYICIKTEGSTITSYGTYSFNDRTAVFQDLTLELEGQTISFFDAQLSGETLFLRWQNESSTDLSTTTMHRLRAYE